MKYSFSWEHAVVTFHQVHVIITQHTNNAHDDILKKRTSIQVLAEPVQWWSRKHYYRRYVNCFTYGTWVDGLCLAQSVELKHQMSQECTLHEYFTESLH